jgi:hypothetical protein
MRNLLLHAAALLTASLACAPALAQSPIFPYPKASFVRATGSFVGDGDDTLVVPDVRSAAADRAAAGLVAMMRDHGVGLTLVTESAYGGGRAILFGVAGASTTLDAAIERALVPGETMPPEGGYVIDVRSDRITIGGADDDGLFAAVATLSQITRADGTVAAAHVWDYPDYPYRWVFNGQNLRGANAIGALRAILDTMSRYKLNAIQQNDFKYSILQMQPDYYFDSVRAYRALSEDRGIGIVPGVAGIGYSEGILWNDPNLAEGFPATSRYVIDADTARAVPDARVALPNGSFESVDGNGKFTGWSYYDESTVTVDRSIVHGGAVSARCSNFNGANSRFIRTVQCRPHSAYLMTAWLRTENLRGGELRLLAIGTDGNGASRTLAYTMYGMSGTSSGWRQVQVVFNTLEFAQINLYVGLWGGSSGTFWVDDFEIRENGLANVLRRPGTPMHVRSASGAVEYREGVDFQPVADPRLGNGVYPWHQPPTFRRTTGGALRNGDTIDISFFHPITTYGDENGIGQVMACISEDTLYAIVRDQVARVDSLYSPSQFFMQHDEIRVLDRDSACLARSMSPAELLADNVTRYASIIDAVHPGARLFTWSDMFDSLHNAVDDYFLVNGDLRGVWSMIPKSVTIGNWNSGSMRASLDFFSRLGFDQIAAPYYDERDTRNIRAWRLALEQTKGAKGMVYTTWIGDYSYLRPFSYYVWGAGPSMTHVPLDTTVLLRPALDSVRIEADVRPDPFDATDRVTSVVAEIDLGTERETVTLVPSGGSTFAGYARRIARSSFAYTITARNAQGLERTTPRYRVAREGISGIERERGMLLSLDVRPNPMSGAGSVSFVAPSSGEWSLSLVDEIGRIAMVATGHADASRLVRVTIDAATLAPGAYRCLVRAGALRAATGMVVR